MNFSKFDQKTVEKSIINTIFKQQVISEPQKLQHFSRAWALVGYKLVACIKRKVYILCSSFHFVDQKIRFFSHTQFLHMYRGEKSFCYLPSICVKTKYSEILHHHFFPNSIFFVLTWNFLRHYTNQTNKSDKRFENQKKKNPVKQTEKHQVKQTDKQPDKQTDTQTDN